MDESAGLLVREKDFLPNRVPRLVKFLQEPSLAELPEVVEAIILHYQKQNVRISLRDFTLVPWDYTLRMYEHTQLLLKALKSSHGEQSSEWKKSFHINVPNFVYCNYFERNFYPCTLHSVGDGVRFDVGEDVLAKFFYLPRIFPYTKKLEGNRQILLYRGSQREFSVTYTKAKDGSARLMWSLTVGCYVRPLPPQGRTIVWPRFPDDFDYH